VRELIVQDAVELQVPSFTPAPSDMANGEYGRVAARVLLSFTSTCTRRPCCRKRSVSQFVHVGLERGEDLRPRRTP